MDNISKIRVALEKHRTYIPAGYACWLIKEYDTIDEVERLCSSEIHNTKKYKVENNYKLNVILKAHDQ